MEKTDWQVLAPQVIYRSYPSSDLMDVAPPDPGESLNDYQYSCYQCGDTLFEFLVREANDDIDLDEYLKRLNRAIEDIRSVKRGFCHLLLGGSIDELGA